MQKEILSNTQNGAINLRDLQECHWSRVQMELLEESILQLQSKATYRALAYSQSGSRSKTGKGSNIEDCIADIQRLESKWRQQLQRFCQANQRVEAAIESLPDKEAAVIRLRYVKALSWKNVSREINYEESWCRKIATRALKRLELVESSK